MRYRITVRGERCELRGYVDMDLPELQTFSMAMKPFGIVLASPADENYDPFTEWTA